eukprot:CAMPEP_0119539674 /NCGR_PEP_ID=MMETSP1344-20130328/51759_1 /TAXON_ID=236787 /ORGANISM="Florenciella parvula, Strain CCMP2471" /LENGTH=69 /DNA_ID=CAMNT_0007583063 /DNA_START=80 /DNA_END=285 /DNA_ORIENTATION=-
MRLATRNSRLATRNAHHAARSSQLATHTMQLTNALFTYRTARYLRVPALSPGDILDFCSGIGDAEGNVT